MVELSSNQRWVHLRLSALPEPGDPAGPPDLPLRPQERHQLRPLQPPPELGWGHPPSCGSGLGEQGQGWVSVTDI